MARVRVLGGVSWNILVFLKRFPKPTPGNVYPRRVYEAVGSTGAGKALNLVRLGIDVDLHAPRGGAAWSWVRSWPASAWAPASWPTRR